MTTERRVHPRQPIATPYAVNILSRTGTVLGVAVPIDVSQGGFRADASRGYPPGESLRLEVWGPHRLAGRQVSFVVAWSAKGDGGWQLGGRFSQALTGEEADRLRKS